MKNKKRYCLERFVSHDPEKNLEVWELTEYCDDKIHILETMFLAPGYRIWDTKLKKEIRRNMDF